MMDNPNNCISTPIKAECKEEVVSENDITILSADFHGNNGPNNTDSWDLEIQKTMHKVVANFDEKNLGKVLEKYLQMLKQQTTCVTDKQNLISKIENHIKLLTTFFHEGEDCSLKRNYYLYIMEDIVAVYCNLKLDLIRKIKKMGCKKLEYFSTIKETAQKMCNLISTALFHNLKHILHVLLKVKKNEQEPPAWKDFMKQVYWHFLLSYPIQDYSAESFCRNYLLLERWKQILKPENHNDVEKSIFNRCHQTPESIKSDSVINSILLPSSIDSVSEIVGHVFGLNNDPVTNYFGHIQKEKQLFIAENPQSSSNHYFTIDIDMDNEKDECSKVYNEIIKEYDFLKHKPKSIEQSVGPVPSYTVEENNCIVIDDDSEESEEDLKSNEDDLVLILSDNDDSDCEMAYLKKCRKIEKQEKENPKTSFLGLWQSVINDSSASNKNNDDDDDDILIIEDKTLTEDTSRKMNQDISCMEEEPSSSNQNDIHSILNSLSDNCVVGEEVSVSDTESEQTITKVIDSDTQNKKDIGVVIQDSEKCKSVINKDCGNCQCHLRNFMTPEPSKEQSETSDKILSHLETETIIDSGEAQTEICPSEKHTRSIEIQTDGPVLYSLETPPSDHTSNEPLHNNVYTQLSIISRPPSNSEDNFDFLYQIQDNDNSSVKSPAVLDEDDFPVEDGAKDILSEIIIEDECGINEITLEETPREEEASSMIEIVVPSTASEISSKDNIQNDLEELIIIKKPENRKKDTNECNGNSESLEAFEYFMAGVYGNGSSKNEVYYTRDNENLTEKTSDDILNVTDGEFFVGNLEIVSTENVVSTNTTTEICSEDNHDTNNTEDIRTNSVNSDEIAPPKSVKLADFTEFEERVHHIKSPSCPIKKSNSVVFDENKKIKQYISFEESSPVCQSPFYDYSQQNGTGSDSHNSPLDDVQKPVTKDSSVIVPIKTILKKRKEEESPNKKTRNYNGNDYSDEPNYESDFDGLRPKSNGSNLLEEYNSFLKDSVLNNWELLKKKLEQEAVKPHRNQSCIKERVYFEKPVDSTKSKAENQYNNKLNTSAKNSQSLKSNSEIRNKGFHTLELTRGNGNIKHKSPVKGLKKVQNSEVTGIIRGNGVLKHDITPKLKKRKTEFPNTDKETLLNTKMNGSLKIKLPRQKIDEGESGPPLTKKRRKKIEFQLPAMQLEEIVESSNY